MDLGLPEAPASRPRIRALWQPSHAMLAILAEPDMRARSDARPAKCRHLTHLKPTAVA